MLSAAPAIGLANDTRLPLTVVERTSACVEVEDADPARAIALADSVLAESVPAEPLQRAEALGCRGWASASLEKRDDARRDAHAVRALAVTLPATSERVRLTRRAGGILHRSGDRIGAVDLYAAAVADAEAQGLEAERIPLLVNLGVLHSEFEEHERARVNYEQALALMEHLGDFRHEAAVRFNLALNLAGQSRDADALPHLRRALDLMRSSGIGGARHELLVRIAFANALLKTGDVDGSRRVADEVRAMDPALLDASTRMQLDLFEADLLARSGLAQAALDILDRLDASAISDFQRWNVSMQRATALEQLGRYKDAADALRGAGKLREAYLRNQNHERLAALDAHLRDREQRSELERLQLVGIERERQMRDNARLQWIGLTVATLLLALGAGMLLWQRRMNKRLYLASRTDPLTGLANRRAMADHLRELSRRPDATALLLIDIDHFKRINDERGHDMGDEVLMSFAERLRTRAGGQVLVARWGGEEFLVVSPHSDAEAACALADKLRHDLARPIESAQGPLVAEVSIGVANLPLPGAHPGPDAWHASLQLADSALYLAKRSGRNAWVCYWIDQPIADWPAERLGSEAPLARSLGLITPRASRPLRDALAAVAS